MKWMSYYDDAPAGHTAVGDLQIARAVESPQLGNQRDVVVYLPRSYSQHATTRYPVIYMHDGQNCFDAATSFSGEWRVDETMEALGGEGFEAIVVAVANAGRERLNEYSPFRDPRHGGGRGNEYLGFLFETLKPIVDARFRTRPERRATGLIGSSMGGLISLYGLFKRAHEVGFCAAMSPSIWFARGSIYHYIERQPPILARIYLDTGLREGQRMTDPPVLRTLLNRSGTRSGAMYDLLVAKGYRPEEEIRFVEDPEGEHNEPAWARRLPDALRFLLHKFA